MKVERQFVGDSFISGVSQEHFSPFSRRDAPVGSGALTPRSLPRAKLFYFRYGKRLFDVIFSTLFLILIGSWLLPLLAIFIKLDSPGPALFRQKRVGVGGRIFVCLKFRTMSHDPNAVFAQTQRNDPRVTRVGSFLRRTNLDEIPQFLNVLAGQMSVVGPRPHVPELDEAFAGSVPSYSSRNLVRPGVTGLAQVSGCRGETRSVREMTHRVRFDIFYIRSISFGMDIQVILKTILSVVRGDKHAF